MKLVDLNEVKDFMGGLDDKTHLMIKNISGEDLSTLPKCLNILTSFVDVIDLQNLVFKDGAVTVRIGVGLRKVKTVSYQTLKEAFESTDVALTNDSYTTKTTLSGLVYSPTLDLPFYFNRTTGTLLNPAGDLVPKNKARQITKNARNLYEKHIKEYMPVVHLLEAQRAKLIKESQKQRGFKRIPKVGDVVKVLDYSTMAEMYGEVSEGAPVHYIKALSTTYGVAFIKPLDYLCGKSATITSYNKTTGICNLELQEDGKNIFNVTEVTIDGEVHEITPKPKFHEQMLRIQDEESV